jgi:hypothetical protein
MLVIQVDSPQLPDKMESSTACTENKIAYILIVGSTCNDKTYYEYRGENGKDHANVSPKEHRCGF